MTQQDNHEDMLSMTAEELRLEIMNLDCAAGRILDTLGEPLFRFRVNAYARDYIMRRLWMAQQVLEQHKDGAEWFIDRIHRMDHA